MGHDCTIALCLLVDGGELSLNNSYSLHPCTTGFATCNQGLYLQISALFTHQTGTVCVLLHARGYTFAHLKHPIWVLNALQ